MDSPRDDLPTRSLLVTFALPWLLLIWVLGAHAQSPAAEPSGVAASSTPQATLMAFYHWYLEAIAKDRNPVQDDRATIETYVSEPLVQEIDRRINSREGMDHDYFIRAQDYLDDWLTNIVVSDVKIDGTAASAMVTLGRTKASRHALALTLVEDEGKWKISRVSQSGKAQR